jgi:hypothetical protein
VTRSDRASRFRRLLSVGWTPRIVAGRMMA